MANIGHEPESFKLAAASTAIFLKNGIVRMAGMLMLLQPVAGVAAGTGMEHWAFAPLRQEFAVPSSAWSRGRLDDFVVEKLASAGLKPAPESSRRVLIRRLSFQLTGLPPAREEVAAFLADETPDALERLVDRLLASPRFGERWGRHWLDLARYADSNGLDENFLFREAWRYRNWVIDAVNADLPFDRFTLEQLAGDLLPYESIGQRDRQRIASGFLVIGPKVLLGNMEERQRMEIADEQIDTVGRGFLGLTLGCARCHDHKFEPVSTRDYYALAGIFTSTKVMETRYMLGEQRGMEQLIGLGENGAEADTAYEDFWRDKAKTTARLQQAKSVLDLLKKEDAAGLDQLLKEHPDALAGEAARMKPYAAQEKLITDLDALLAHPPGIPPRAMVPSDVEKPADEWVRMAGQFDQRAAAVPRGFLPVLGGGKTPVIPENRSGRLELAQWLTDPEHGAGNLTARVLANRIWYHLIGQGIVKSVDNFGRSGELPSHPELLDFLAGGLLQSHWSVKSLVRQIVLSRTFAMASEPAGDPVEAETADPDNRWLWKANRQRLDPESLRDAILLLSGKLDLARVESTVAYLGDQATAVGDNKNRRRTDFNCRSIYLPVIRNDLPEVFAAFDFTNPHTTMGARPQTVSPAQALFLMNDEVVMAAAEAAAKPLISLEGGLKIGEVFEQILGTLPTPEEKLQIADFVLGTAARLTREGKPDPLLQAWAMACQALFSSSRFQFID